MDIDKITFNQLPQEVRDALPPEVREQLEAEDAAFLAIRPGFLKDRGPFVIDEARQKMLRSTCSALHKLVNEIEAQLDGDASAITIVSLVAHLATVIDPHDGVIPSMFDDDERTHLLTDLAVRQLTEERHDHCGNAHEILEGLGDELVAIAVAYGMDVED